MVPSKKNRGFTLVELMIVVAVIGILAAIAVPNFIAYRNKSRVASGIATASSIRGAFAGHASVSDTNTFPTTADLQTWASLTKLCNMHGAVLTATRQEQGFSFVQYHGVSTTGALDSCTNVAGNECSDLCIVFRIMGVPAAMMGSQLELRSSGIVRQSY